MSGILSPAPGQQPIMEVPLPRDINIQKRVRITQAKPLSDEPKIHFGSSVIVGKLGQESYVTSKMEKKMH